VKLLFRASELNHLVSVSTTTISSVTEIDFTLYHLCCFSGVPLPTLLQANLTARTSKTQFFATDTFGFFGFLFSDLGEVFTYEKTEDIKGTKEIKRMSAGFVTLDAALRASWDNTTSPVFVMILALQEFWNKHNRAPTINDSDELESSRSFLIDRQMSRLPKANYRKLKNSETFRLFAKSLGAELSPVCAVVGGLGAQEIVRAICRNEEPLKNFFTYNSLDGGGWVGDMF